MNECVKMAADALYRLRGYFVFFALFCFIISIKHKDFLSKDLNRLSTEIIAAGDPVSKEIFHFVDYHVDFKRRDLASHYQTRRPSFKATKHGAVCLVLPSRVFVMDLTVFVDISRNPGPVLGSSCMRAKSALGSVTSRLTGTACFNYSRSQLLSLKASATSISPDIAAKFQDLGLVRARGVRTQYRRVVRHGYSSVPVLRRPCHFYECRMSQLDLLLARLGSVILRLYWNHFTGSPSSLEFILRLFCLLLSAFMD